LFLSPRLVRESLEKKSRKLCVLAEEREEERREKGKDLACLNKKRGGGSVLFLAPVQEKGKESKKKSQGVRCAKGRRIRRREGKGREGS